MRSTTLLTLCATLLCAPGCGGSDSNDDANAATKSCDFTSAPVSHEASGPTLTKLVLDCEAGGSLTPAATATHPDGDAAIQNIDQTLSLCSDTACTETSVVWTDDFVGSGIEEYFGAASATASANLLESICGGQEWPVAVKITDSTGRTLSKTVCASVTDNR